MKTFTFFYSFLWKYKEYFILSQITAFISIASYSSIPFIYRYLIDNFQNLTAQSFFAVVMVYGSIRIGGILFGNLSWFLAEKVQNPAEVDVKVKVFSHLQKLDFIFHTAKKSGELISKIKRGGSAFERMDSEINRELTDDFFRLIIIAGAFSMISLKITYIFIFSIATIILISTFLIKNNVKLRVRYNKEEDNISHIIADNLINYETVKYFVSEKREIFNLVEAFKKWTISAWKLITSSLRINASVRLLSAIATIIILAMLGGDVINKKITAGDFILVMTFLMQIFPNIEKIVFRLRDIMKDYTDLKDYLDILDIPLVVLDPENPLDFKCEKGEVEFKNLSFSYQDGQESLKNISIAMSAGTSTALVGRSGSGKTTMTKLLMRVYDPNEGQVLVDGFDIRQIKKEDLRRNIGIVPQEPILFNSSIGYNIGYSLENATKEEIENAAKLANLHDFIVTLEKGYDTVVGERGVKLSGGQKQRVAIARALVTQPKLVLADEPTAPLDSERALSVVKILDRLAREYQTAIIVVTHDEKIIPTFKRIYYIRDGKTYEERGEGRAL